MENKRGLRSVQPGQGQDLQAMLAETYQALGEKDMLLRITRAEVKRLQQEVINLNARIAAMKGEQEKRDQEGPG